MARKWRAAVAALGVLGLGAVTIPVIANAQKVNNPGTFSLRALGGFIDVGSTTLDLTPNPLPQCSDGTDNDGDGRIDLADSQCAAGPQGQPRSDDDNEMVPGFQPKVDVSIDGSIDDDGNVSVLQDDIVFPPGYIALTGPDGSKHYVTITVLPIGNGTGKLDPLSGKVDLNVKFRVRLSGYVAGFPLSGACSIGTVASPISVNLTTDRLENPPGGVGALQGGLYNPNNGQATLVENRFAVPRATGCALNGIDINQTVNDSVGLPSAAGRNRAVLIGQTNPSIQRAVNPRITSDPTPLSTSPARETPFTATFSAETSEVAVGPATYLWKFPDGSTATGLTATKTFTNSGINRVELVVTDAEGDSASAAVSFVLQAGTGPTTTTASTTTTTTAPTTTASTTTTTTAPTTTTASTTTTTTAPTTTTASTTTTTASTTTTTAPTTTIPQPSDDQVSVKLTGALNYINSGSGTGDVTVRRDSFGISAVNGTLNVPGTSGGTATVKVNVTRAWILPLWTGQVSVTDSNAGVRATAPVLGQINRGATEFSAKAVSSWFVPGAWPNLIRPFNLEWSVVDAD